MNPLRGDASAATREADQSTEKRWVRSHLSEHYLWNDELPDVDAEQPAFIATQTGEYLGSMTQYLKRLTLERTPSAESTRDRYSFLKGTKDYNLSVQSGVAKSTGASWMVVSQDPRVIRVRLVYPDTPAAQAGLRRGDQLVSVNGASVADPSEATKTAINRFLDGSADAGTYQVVVQRDGQTLSPLALNLGEIQLAPVTDVQVLAQADGRQVGYLAFHSHNLAAEPLILAAARQFQAAQVTDLVLDLRYNGGGRINIANMLASVLVSPDRTNGKHFNAQRFNAQQSNRNQAYAFVKRTVASQPATELPHLNLSRVYVLTSSRTCSASELIINGLEGIDVPVIRVGSTTCGKPHGMIPVDNCGITYSAIEFKSVNHKGYGDYEQGITPTCQVSEDLNQALGSAQENLLRTALAHRASGQCPAGTQVGSRRAGRLQVEADAPLQPAEWEFMNMYSDPVTTPRP